MLSTTRIMIQQHQTRKQHVPVVFVGFHSFIRFKSFNNNNNHQHHIIGMTTTTTTTTTTSGVSKRGFHNSVHFRSNNPFEQNFIRIVSNSISSSSINIKKTYDQCLVGNSFTIVAAATACAVVGTVMALLCSNETVYHKDPILEQDDNTTDIISNENQHHQQKQEIHPHPNGQRSIHKFNNNNDNDDNCFTQKQPINGVVIKYQFPMIPYPSYFTNGDCLTTTTPIMNNLKNMMISFLSSMFPFPPLLHNINITNNTMQCTQCEVVGTSSPNDATVVPVVQKRTTSTTVVPTSSMSSSSSSSLSISSTPPKSKIIFLGTGSSTGCPRPLCSMIFADKEYDHIHKNDTTTTATTFYNSIQQQYLPFCQTSILASRGNPIHNKNYRNNPSLLISLSVPSSSSVNEEITLDTTIPSNITEMTTTTTIVPKYVQKNILIDSGKTFRETTIRWLPYYHITSLDAILLTHEHMDAAGGLDDVRGYQKWLFHNPTNDSSSVSSASPFSSSSTSTPTTREDKEQQQQQQPSSTPKSRPRSSKPMPLYLSRQCYQQLQKQFSWLLPKKEEEEENDEKEKETSPKVLTSTDATSNLESTTDVDNDSCNQCSRNSSTTTTKTETIPKVVRYVASFDVNVFEPFIPMPMISPDILTILPLPVIHGEDFISFGFAFSIPHTVVVGTSPTVTDVPQTQQQQQPPPPPPPSLQKTATNVLYLSDLSRMLPETMEYIRTTLPPTDIFIVDTLLWNHTNAVHYNLHDAIQLGQQIQEINNIKYDEQQQQEQQQQLDYGVGTDNNVLQQPNQLRCTVPDPPRIKMYLVGMNCDDFPSHDEMNVYLQLTYGKLLDVQFAHDGLVIEIG